MTCGIYKIENIENNKSYIGSSKDIEGRWKRHNYELSRDKHHSLKLQRAWNKANNPTMFLFTIIEECEQSQLLTKEQYWIDSYNSYYKGYNCCKYATGGEKDPIPATVLEKSETRLDNIFKNFKTFKEKMESSSVQDLEVSYWSLRLGDCATATTGFICRLSKLSNILINIEEQLSIADPNLSYHLTDFNYRDQGSVYIIPQVDIKKNSVHNKNKKFRVLDIMWQEVQEHLNNRVGKSIMERFNNYLSAQNRPLN